MSSCAALAVDIDLRQMAPAELMEMVIQLRGIVAQKDRSLELLQECFDMAVDQRDAALLLNELCHY
jgi:hypothetical protein